MEVFETRLPGVGVRYEFHTESGEPIGVVVRRDGVREVALFDADDPDRCKASVSVGPADAAVLVDLLGGSKLTERLADLRQEVEGLAIEWITLPAVGGLAGRTIGDGRIRTDTGASVVAVVRGGTSHPGPGPEFRLEAGDKVLVMGSDDAVELAGARLAG
ncbi:MAG TPA: potassium transporter TrkA [Acidimicrobiaceae bacterium]|nr:potassium transporter TrkA [Acidimicrobiaceae bacterium]